MWVEVDIGDDKRAEEMAKFRPYFRSLAVSGRRNQYLEHSVMVEGQLLLGCMYNFVHRTDLSISTCLEVGPAEGRESGKWH